MSSAALLWALFVGVCLPGLTAVVTKANIGPAAKAMLQALLAGVIGSVAGTLLQPPHGVGQWEQIAGSIVVIWLASGASYVAGWHPTGAYGTITRATARFGFGPAEPPAGVRELPKAREGR